MKANIIRGRVLIHSDNCHIFSVMQPLKTGKATPMTLQITIMIMIKMFPRPIGCIPLEFNVKTST